jgi:hypothetical protein
MSTGKTIQMGNSKSAQNASNLVEQIKTNKKTFIPPKQKMKESIDNDANYLMALGQFIEAAQKEAALEQSLKRHYNAAKIQLEIFDAIAKFQANEGIVLDKTLHYEKVFLPMYERDLEESKANFLKLLSDCVEISNVKSGNADEQKIIDYIAKEISIFKASEYKKDEEFELHTYKILKRLFNKHKEILAVDDTLKK